MIERLTSIRLVAGIAGKASTERKGASVGDGVLVVVSVRVFGVYLPLQASAARGLVPPAHDVVEAVNCDIQVVRGSFLGIGELVLERRHDSKRPESLVIVARLAAAIVHDEVVGRPVVGCESLLERLRKAVVSGEHAVLDHALSQSQ